MNEGICITDLTKPDEIEPKEPKYLIDGLFRVGDINLIAYDKKADIIALISALAATVTSSKPFAYKPVEIKKNVILLYKNEHASFTKIMKKNGADPTKVFLPDPLGNLELNADYIDFILNRIENTALLVLHSIEDILTDETFVTEDEAYETLCEIANICALHNCTLVVTSQMFQSCTEEKELNDYFDLISRLDRSWFLPGPLTKRYPHYSFLLRTNKEPMMWFNVEAKLEVSKEKEVAWKECSSVRKN